MNKRRSHKDLKAQELQALLADRGANPSTILIESGPVASRVETAAPTPTHLIPDGCNLGTVLRVVLAANLAMLVLCLAAVPSFSAFTPAVLSVAAVVEPITLGTLLCWCVLRRSVDHFSATAQRLLAWAVPALLAGAGLSALQAFGANYSVLGGMVLAYVGGVVAQHYLEVRERAFSPAVAEARFQALQSRIRPHFFFNSLNAVLAVVRDDPRRAERMLENIAELFRAVMGDVRKLVPLDQEIDLCRRYVEIEQTRLGERLKVDWQISAVHPRARVPQLLLQPIIENAVRYGAEKQAGDCEIVARVQQHGFNLHFFVSNPIAQDPVQREGNQIGLKNIRGRLALIYDLEAQLETRIRRGRFELTLTIPIENKASR